MRMNFSELRFISRSPAFWQHIYSAHDSRSHSGWGSINTNSDKRQRTYKRSWHSNSRHHNLSFCQEGWRWWWGESSWESRRYTNEHKFQVYANGIFYATKNKSVRYLPRVTTSKWKVFTDVWLLLITAKWYFSTDLPDSMGKSLFPVELPFPLSHSQLLHVHAWSQTKNAIFFFFSPGPWVILLTFSHILHPFLFYVSFSAKGENDIQKSSILILLFLSCVILPYPYLLFIIQYRLYLHVSLVHLFQHLL